MSEAEVSLHLASWLIRQKFVSEDDNEVLVAIPGTTKLDVAGFLHDNHWRKTRSTAVGQVTYRCPDAASRLVVCSASGSGDVVCRLQGGGVFRAQAAKGPLFNSKESEEYRLIREAIGRLLTIPDASRQDFLAVAVPRSPRFIRLAYHWREAPLIKRLGVIIFTVGQDGQVDKWLAWSLRNYRTQQEAIVAQKVLDNEVKDLLRRVAPDFPPVKGKERPGYIDFAREGMQAILRWHYGGTCDLAMAHLVRKWTGMGCTRELLLRIAKKCFDWIPREDRPVSPSPIQPGLASLNTGLPASTRRSSRLK